MARDFVRSIEDSRDIKKEDINTTEENDIVSDPKASYINHRGTFKKITGGVEDLNIENLDKKITNNDDGTKDLNFTPNDEKIVDYLGKIVKGRDGIDVKDEDKEIGLYLNRKDMLKDIEIENLNKEEEENEDGTKNLKFIPNNEDIVNYLKGTFTKGGGIETLIKEDESGKYLQPTIKTGKGIAEINEENEEIKIDNEELNNIFKKEILGNYYSEENGKITILQGNKELSKFIKTNRTSTEEEFKSITLLETYYNKNNEGNIEITYKYGIPIYSYTDTEGRKVWPGLRVAFTLIPLRELKRYISFVGKISSLSQNSTKTNVIEITLPLNEGIEEDDLIFLVPNLIIVYEKNN